MIEKYLNSVSVSLDNSGGEELGSYKSLKDTIKNNIPF